MMNPGVPRQYLSSLFNLSDENPGLIFFVRFPVLLFYCLWLQQSNMIKCGLFFNILYLPCGPNTSSIGVAALGFPWYTNSRTDPRKVLNCRSDLIIDGPILLPSQVGFFFFFFFWGGGGQKIVRWCQIKRISRVINSSKPQSRKAAIATTDLCAGALSWCNRTRSSVLISRPF